MSFTLWRGVVGMVRPTRRPGTLEELIRILPEGIGVVPLLLNFKVGSAAEFLKSIPLYERFAADLAEQGVHLIILSGAPPFMLLGPRGEAKLTREWEKKFKTPVVTDPQMTSPVCARWASRNSSERATQRCRTRSCSTT